MKIIFISLILITQSVFSQTEINIDSLYRENNKYLNRKNHRPFSGNVYIYLQNQGKVNVGNLINGEQHGHWTSWYKNGQKKSDGYYYKFGGWIYLEGLWTSWYENGQKKDEGHYNGDNPGHRIGKWTSWHSNGQKASEGNYKDWGYGGQDGKWIWWYENGQKKEEGSYKHGKEDECCDWDLKDGKWTSWYENGQKKREMGYKDDEFDGPYIRYKENGLIDVEGNYKDGEKHGRWTWYWELDGVEKKREQKSYLYGKLNGIYREYNFNDKYTDLEGNYKDGEKDGEWIWWGSPRIGRKKKKVATYKNGKLIDEKCWHPYLGYECKECDTNGGCRSPKIFWD